MRNVIHAKLFFLVIISASCSKPIIDKVNSTIFYSDYDIFKRKGIKVLNKEDLKLPFIQVYSETDTTITLHVFTNSLENFDENIIPKKDGIILFKEHDYNDNPNIIFGTILKNKIVRYGYYGNPFQITPKDTFIHLEEIRPTSIQIISEKNFKSSWGLELIEPQYGNYKIMKDKIIYPFKSRKILSKKDEISIIEKGDSVSLGNLYFQPKYFKKYRFYLNPLMGM